MKKNKSKQGGARPGAGRPNANYSEPIIEKKIRIPKSKAQFFSDLAKSEREKVKQ